MTTDSNNRRSKILFIEDESGFRQVIAELLLKHGFEVLEAADGKEGYAAQRHLRRRRR